MNFIPFTVSSLRFALGFLTALVFALGSSAHAQSKIPRVGILFIGGRDQPHLETFKQGLRERGYIEGKNIAFEYRYAEGNVDRVPSLAAELVQLKVDVIVTTSGNSARAAAQATKTIPVVLTTGADPVKSGLAESLAKPGGNVTGLSVIEEDLSGKRVEILKETFPKMTPGWHIFGTPSPCFIRRPAQRAAIHLTIRQKKRRNLSVYNFFHTRRGICPR